MTGCPACAARERQAYQVSHRGHFLETAAAAATVALTRVLAPRPSPMTAALWGMSAMLGAAAEDPPAVDWYAEHRKEYAQTGDMAELERMLAHVTLTEPRLGPVQRVPRARRRDLLPFGLFYLVVAVAGALMVLALFVTGGS